MKQRGACLIILIIIIALIFVGLIKIGLIKVPMLSNWLYHEPQKLETVALTGDQLEIARTSLEIKLSAVITRVADASEQKPVHIEISISQEELTAMLRSAMGNQVSNVAVGINKEAIILYGEIVQPFKGVLRVLVKPVVTDGYLSLQLKEITLGGLPIAPVLGDMLIKQVLGGKLDELNKTINKAGKLKSIDLVQGNVILKAVVLNAQDFLKLK